MAAIIQQLPPSLHYAIYRADDRQENEVM